MRQQAPGVAPPQRAQGSFSPDYVGSSAAVRAVEEVRHFTASDPCPSSGLVSRTLVGYVFSRSTAWPVRSAMSSKSLSTWSTVWWLISAVAAINKSGIDGAR